MHIVMYKSAYLTKHCAKRRRRARHTSRYVSLHDASMDDLFQRWFRFSHLKCFFVCTRCN